MNIHCLGCGALQKTLPTPSDTRALRIECDYCDRVFAVNFDVWEVT